VAIIRWSGRIIGGALILIGVIPFTPLIWLLVLVRGNPFPFLEGVHLKFWQTQTMGAALAVCGMLIIYMTRRKRPQKAP
jgi:hypothetical protein